MGRAIQARLADSGFDVVGWDRDAVAMQLAAERGMTIAAHPRAVADGAGTVISIITEDHGVRSIFRGKDGFLSGDVRGKLFIEMSTLQPMTGRELAPVVEAAGGRADRIAGARHHSAGARRQAVRHGRRQGGGHGARPPGAGEAHPQDRAYGAERRGLRHEARGQSRARGLHPGDGGIARARHARGLALQQMLDVLGEAPTANGWFAAKKKLLAGEPADVTLDLKTLRKDMMSAVATGRARRHRHAAVGRRADRAVGRGGAGLGRQGHRRAGAVFPRAHGAEIKL